MACQTPNYCSPADPVSLCPECISDLEEAIERSQANFGALGPILYEFTPEEEKEIHEWLDKYKELMGDLAELEDIENNRD